MFDFKQHREFILRRVKRGGFDKLYGHDLFLAIAETFFCERAPGERDEIRGALYDCCEHVADSVLASRLVREDLKRVFGELEYVARVRRPRRGPVPSRKISAATLSVIAWRLPDQLKPLLDGDGRSHRYASVFGIAEKPDNKEQDVFITSPRSEILRGGLDFYSAEDSLVGFAGNSSHWPESLTELGFGPSDEIDRSVSIREILDLPRRHQAEIRRLCVDAHERLRLLFGIKRTHDPLRVNAASSYFRPPMARLLGCLCEIIAPFPMIADAEQYRIVYIASALSGWPDLYSIIYRYLERRIGEELNERLGNAMKPRGEGDLRRHVRREAKAAMKIAGLLDNRESDNECVRYMERFITCHRQIALLHAVRETVAKSLEGVDFASSAVVALPNSNGSAVGWSDYHNLGRWTDALRGRLELGLVDSGRDEKLRFRLPKQKPWRWPREAATAPPIERLIDPLVRSARRASGKRDDAITAPRNRAAET